MLEVHALRKRFGAVTALDGATFDAADGAVTGLLGPNGAGKSTALRVLYTVLRPDGGCARVDGRDVVREAPAARRRLGAMPHATGLYPRLSARENIEYFGRLHRLRGPDLARRVRALVDRLDLGEIAERRAHGFSQGQRVKVALARALVHDPPNVVLDEPTSGLDIAARRAVRELVRELRDEGRCVLLSSHVMQEVAAVCDRVVILARGRVAACGAPADLLASRGHGDLEAAFLDAVGAAPSGGGAG